MKRVYENFVEKAVDETLTRCRDDLTALTRFVTWDLHERSAGALRRSLPDSSMVHIYSMAVRTIDCCFLLWGLAPSLASVFRGVRCKYVGFLSMVRMYSMAARGQGVLCV